MRTWITPVSLLANITVTMMVLGRTAEMISTASTRPLRL